MRIGLFGGSFDPVHTEHIQLVRAAVKSLNLDKLIVLPAATPPHKKGKEMSDASVRLEMCRIAFANEPKVEISDYEIVQGGTSYTYLTCRHFKESYKGEELFFLVGTDMLRDFPTWKNPRLILEDATLAVCARAEKTGWLEKERQAFFEKFQKDFAVIAYEGADVSSTEIRALSAAGQPITSYVGENVERFIREKGLYDIDGAIRALALQKPSRAEHSVRVATFAAKYASVFHLLERKVLTAALLHDCAKNLQIDSPLLDGFVLDTRFGDVPEAVLHQFTGAYVAENALGVKDEDVLNAIRYHTSGRTNMTPIEKLIFLADMLEKGRTFDGVSALRDTLDKARGAANPETYLDACLVMALESSIKFVRQKGGTLYPLTAQAYDFYKTKAKGEI